MSPTGDYVVDMPGMPISDADVEALLTRREPTDAGLQGLANALDRIDPMRLGISVDERAGVFSLRAAAIVRHSGVPSTLSVPWWRRIAPKLATGALSAMMVIGMTGVAVASDDAAPGDALYGLDRALEAVGINDGGVEERLDEAAKLADQGQTIEALDHAAEALSKMSPEASEALLHAAESVAKGQDVNDDVALMLQWMATTDLTGRDFGQGVAERARQLGANRDEDGQGPATEAPGNSGNTPGGTAPGNSGETPGNSGDTPGGTAPGNNGETPGNSGNTPGGTAPGNNGSTPGGTAPGNNGNPGGNSGNTPGNTAPGRGGK